MLFNSLEYLFLFLPITFIFVKIFTDLRILILIFFSIFFYSFWSIKYILLVISIISINYFFGKKILASDKKIKKKILITSILINIFILFLFKYLDFAILNINLIFSADIKYLNILYPLAISFITFQQIIFLVDCYDENIKITNDKNPDGLKFSNYFLFVIFFPQLIAGPITRYNNIIIQFKNINKINYEILSKAFFLISIGLFKKCFLADNLSIEVDKYFLNFSDLNIFEAWYGSICFTLQFYFDFSAYTDLALGSALLFGVNLPKNFNSPLKAISIISFWQRWHMTLTSFLTNYVYLTILRKIKKLNFFKIMLVTLFTFLIAGIWHGPAWTFLLFGIWHGLMLVINHTFRNFKISMNKYFCWMLTFICVNIGFVIFRSLSVENSFVFILNMFNFSDFYVLLIKYLSFDFIKSISTTKMLIFLCSTLVIFLKKNSNQYIDKFKPNLKSLISFIILFGLSLISFHSGSEFIYFKY